ncbi:hypothetical protein G6011_05808 [Alternaria panax]|uniref:Uncharacterized protein n=1 Tax=Alternaria panax TaxID=48097 RepID=A0AAD4I4W7_9PLEO|nr:hypothetical protein G6011_05808 [Alternaria panax]
MARLSAPANETLNIERRANRSREIFKHRRSSSVSASPATLTKSPLYIDPSPLSSPNIPPGFQQIGLLPSERSSSNSRHLTELDGHDRNTEAIVAEARIRSERSELTTRNAYCDSNNGRERPAGLNTLVLAKLKTDNQVKKRRSFAQSIRHALSQRPVNNRYQDSAATDTTTGEDLSLRNAGNADKRNSLPLGSSHKIAESMYNKNNSSYTDSGIDGYGSFLASPLREPSIPWADTMNFTPADGISHTGSFHRDAPNNLDSTESSGSAKDANSKENIRWARKSTTGEFLADVVMPEQTVSSIETAAVLGMNTTLLNDDESSGHRKSFTFKIFDDNSSLSQGIREYVNSKIAEALAEHERAHFTNCDTLTSPLLQFTIKIDAAGGSRWNTSASISDKKTDLFRVPSSIGPLKNKSSLPARNIQLVIMALYVITFLGALLLRPKTLLLAVWRLTIMLVLYTALRCQLNWTENVERDVFVAPVFFTAGLAKGMTMQLLDQHLHAYRIVHEYQFSKHTTTTTKMSPTGPEAVPHAIANFLVTKLTDVTIYVQDLYGARQERARLQAEEESDRQAKDAHRRAMGRIHDDDRSLMGDWEAEERRMGPQLE